MIGNLNIVAGCFSIVALLVPCDSIYDASAICSWHTIFCQTRIVLVFLSSSSKFISVQSLILSMQSFLGRSRAFDPEIFPINTCDSNLFPHKMCLTYRHLAFPILSIRLKFLFVVFFIHPFDFFGFQLVFNILHNTIFQMNLSF